MPIFSMTSDKTQEFSCLRYGTPFVTTCHVRYAPFIVLSAGDVLPKTLLMLV